MAAPVKSIGGALLAACCAFGAQRPALAETLFDPTVSPLGTGTGTGTDAATAIDTTGAAAQRATRRVQMIVRGPGETRTALIDGNRVRVGDTLQTAAGAARVERITDTSVVLARGGSHETLQLIPGIERSVRCTARKPDAQPTGC